MSHTLIKTLLFALLALACLPATGSSDVFERDWRQPGDGLLTYDAVNRREWLDLPVSLLTQFPEPHYENAVAELRPGGLFEGFTVAVSGDVLALAESAGINTQTNAAAVNFDATVNLMDLLGTTFGGFRSHGFLDEITEQGGGCPCRLAALFFTGGGGAGLSIASGEDLLRPSTAGLMLYRQAIPEPNSVALILLPFLGAVVARSRSFGHFHVRQLLFTALCCFLPVIADAEVFERDWRVGGDGLLTYDDVNRREWLDVPVSLLSQFPEPHYENAVAELVPGGLFDGFTLAVRADVVALAESAGIDTTTTVVAINGAPTRKLIDLLGPTLGSFRIHAFLADFSPFELPVVSIFDVQSNTAGLRIGGTDDFLRFSNSGLMLYRQAIPEPSALLLTIVLSLSALSYRVGHSLIQNRWRIRLNVK